jgi:hypothetical protein
VNDTENTRNEGLSAEELERQELEPLLDRESMSVIGDVTIPLDPTVAADVLLGQDEGDSTAVDAAD